MTVRPVPASVLVGAGLWLAAGALTRSPAQPPRPPDEIEKRLHQLEEKFNRLTVLLTEQRAKDAAPTTPEVEALVREHDQLRDALQKKFREYADARGKAPPAAARGPHRPVASTERLAKLEANRAEVRVRLAESQELLDAIENTLWEEAALPPDRQGKLAAAMLFVLQRSGFDVAAARDGLKRGRLSALNDVALLKLYGDSVRSEMDAAKALLRSLDDLFEGQPPDPGRPTNVDAADGQVREELLRLNKRFEDVGRRLEEARRRKPTQ